MTRLSMLLIKPGEAPLDLMQRFIDAFMEDTTALGIETGATAHPRASQMIPDIIDFMREFDRQRIRLCC